MDARADEAVLVEGGKTHHNQTHVGDGRETDDVFEIVLHHSDVSAVDHVD